MGVTSGRRLWTSSRALERTKQRRGLSVETEWVEKSWRWQNRPRDSRAAGARKRWAGPDLGGEDQAGERGKPPGMRQAVSGWVVALAIGRCVEANAVIGEGGNMEIAMPARSRKRLLLRSKGEEG